MKKYMKRIALPFVISAFLLFLLPHAIVVFASDVLLRMTPVPKPTIDYAMPYPGILPDHPLYVIKRIRDNLLLFFTHDPVKRSTYHLLIADKKIGMGTLLVDKGKVDIGVSQFIDAEQHLLHGVLLLSENRNKNRLLSADLFHKLQLASKKHEEIMQEVLLNLMDKSEKEAIEQAILLNHQATAQIQSMK